jgi:hypothetical protein
MNTENNKNRAPRVPFNGLRVVQGMPGDKTYEHWCPACMTAHRIDGTAHVWDRDRDLPTVTGFLHHTRETYDTDRMRRVLRTSCHYRIVLGVIHYETDSPHAFAGRSVPTDHVPRVPRKKRVRGKKNVQADAVAA